MLFARPVCAFKPIFSFILNWLYISAGFNDNIHTSGDIIDSLGNPGLPSWLKQGIALPQNGMDRTTT